MAQASKRRPWLVELQPPGLSGWFAIDAFRDELEAQARVTLAQKRAPEAKFRYRNITEEGRPMSEADYAAFMGG